ncbi:MAG: DNA repair protein RecN [bacterium]
MLEEIRIRNYALFEDITVQFTDGFNVLTGETGAGKSILIEALGLLLGERASSSLIRQGTELCSATGIFDIEKNHKLKNYIDTLGLSDDAGSLIIRREIARSGKGRCYVNDQPVNLGTLISIGEYLVDMHGQHEHQSLMHLQEQRNMLDSYGTIEPLLESFRRTYDEYKTQMQEFESHKLNEQEKARRIDLLKFQYEEIEQAKLQMNEEEEIESHIPRLKNADKLNLAASQAYDCLYGSDNSVKDHLIKLKSRLETINQVVGDFGNSVSQVDEMTYQCEDIISRIETFRSSLENDPALLDKLMNRLDQIERLKKKYGSSIAEIKDFQGKIKKELDYLENLDEKKSELIIRLKELKNTMILKAQKVSSVRKKHGLQFAALMQKEIRSLGMPKAVFEIKVDQSIDEKGDYKFSASGIDTVEFVISPNPGEEPQGLRKIASGGEISRIMLALKTVAANHNKVPTLIFDEIDAGIGGSMGSVVGDKLSALALTNQVIVITHLPQIASCAKNHLRVSKEVNRNRTKTMVEILTGETRKKEIASMLGGKALSEISLKHAEEILKKSG